MCVCIVPLDGEPIFILVNNNKIEETLKFGSELNTFEFAMYRNVNFQLD